MACSVSTLETKSPLLCFFSGPDPGFRTGESDGFSTWLVPFDSGAEGFSVAPFPGRLVPVTVGWGVGGFALLGMTGPGEAVDFGGTCVCGFTCVAWETGAGCGYGTGAVRVGGCACPN